MTGVILKFGTCTSLGDKVSLPSCTLTLLRALDRILIKEVQNLNLLNFNIAGAENFSIPVIPFSYSK